MASLFEDSPRPSYWLHDVVARGDNLALATILKDPNFTADTAVTCPNGTVYYPLHVALYQRNTAAARILHLLAGASPELVKNDFRRQYGLDLLQETAAGHQDAAAGHPVTSADGPSAMAHRTGCSCESTTVLVADKDSNSNSVDSSKPGVEPISPAPSSNRGTRAEPAAGTGSREEPYPASSPTSVPNDEKAGDARRCHFVELLLEWKADVSGVADLRLGTSWLHEVVRYKLGGSLAAQLVAAGTSLDAGDMKGNTALHYSLEVGDIEMCKTLLQLGANMNLFNKAGFTAFGCACKDGEVELVKHMIQLGADVNGGLRKPLVLACRGTLSHNAYRMPDGVPPTPVQQSYWRSVWQLAPAVREEYAGVVRALLAHDADPQATEDEGNFPLLSAADAGFTEVIPNLAAAEAYRVALAAIKTVETLSKNSASDDCSVMQVQAAVASAKAAAAAGDAAAKARALGSLPYELLVKAAQAGGVEVKTLLAGTAPSANRQHAADGATPLSTAVAWGHISTVEALIKVGADPNLPAGTPGKPPILVAAKLGLLDLVTKLVELGADWPHGRAAAVVGSDVVQLLIENQEGPKKLQPSIVVKLLTAAEKRGQMNRAKVQDSMWVYQQQQQQEVLGRADEVMQQLLELEEQEKQQQQQKASSGSASGKQKRKKARQKEKKKPAAAVLAADTSMSNANADSEDEQQLQQTTKESAELQKPVDEQHELSAAPSSSTSQPTAPAAADTGSAASSQSDSVDVSLLAEAACSAETDTRQTEAQPAVDVQDHIADAAARRASLTGQEGTVGRDKSSSSGGGGGGGGFIVEAAPVQSLRKQSKSSSLLKDGRHSKRSNTDDSHAAANSRSCSTPSSSSVASMARTEGTDEVSQLEHVAHAQPVAAAAGSNTAAASSKAYAVDSSNRRDQQPDNSISSSSTSRKKSNNDAQSVAEAAAAATRAMASLGVGRSRTVSASGGAAIVSAAATAAATAAIMGLGRSSSTRTTDAAGSASSFDSSQQHQLEALETNADKLSRPHNLPQTAATAAADATTGSKQPSNAVVSASDFAGTCKTGTLSAVQLLQQACASESVRSSSSGTAVPSAADQIARLLPPHLLFAKPSNAPPSTSSIALGLAATSQATAQQQQRQHATFAAAADPSQPLMTVAHQPQQQQQRQPQMQPSGPPSSYGCPWQQQYSVAHPEAAQQYPSHTQLSEPSLPTADMQPALYQPKVLHELHRPFGPALASELPHPPQQQQQQYWQQGCSHHPGLLHQHPATSQQWDAPQHSQQQHYRPQGVSLAHSQHSTSISRHTTAVAAGPVAAPAAIHTNSGSHVALVHTSQPPIMPPATAASVQPHVSHSMTWDPLVPTSLTSTAVHPSPATLTFPEALSSTQHPHQQHVQRQHMSPTSTQAVSQQRYGQPMQPWHPPVSVALPASASLAAPAVTFSNHNKAYTLQGNTASAEVALRQLRCLQEKYENMTCCVVCMDQPRSVLLLPCKHLALCEACSKELQSSGGTGECPVCRVPVAQYIEGVYMT